MLKMELSQLYMAILKLLKFHNRNFMKKIIVVDDSEMIRNYHRYILNYLGYEVFVAENGSIALESILNPSSLALLEITVARSFSS